MRVLVTGGAGFIGSHVVDAYIAAGHDVAIIDNLSTGRKEFINPQARFYKIDIRDQEAVMRVVASEKPKVLNHHAAQMDLRKSVTDPVYDAEVNILGLLNLLEAGRQYGLKRVIFASSGGAIYGDTETVPTPETHTTHPASPYGISKLSSEYYLDFYYQMHHISYITLRYGNVYGPRQNPHGEAGVVAIFTEKLLRGVQPIINGDGKQTRDFVFVADVVLANEQALLKSKPLTANIGTGIETDINTIFRQLTQLTNRPISERHGPEKPGEQRRSALDCRRAHIELDWQAQTSLTEGLSATLDYFRSHRL